MTTVFYGTFKYKDQLFTLREDFGEGYNPETAEWMFTEGNYSCDCNRSLFIRRQHGEHVMPELDCGDEIELIDYHIELEERV